MTPLETAGSLRAAKFRRLQLSSLGVVATVLVAACATPVESGRPIADPAAVVARAMREAGAGGPVMLKFEWQYGDPRGDVQGEGVGRYTPADSLRVDLFTSGEAAMAIAVVGEELRSAGEIEDVEVPPVPFLYAMAGLFRPGREVEMGAFEVGRDSVVVYADSPRKRYFFVRRGRLRRVEERQRGRLLRRVNVEWPDASGWPHSAEYRDLLASSRARWVLREVTPAPRPFPPDIYDLPPRP